MSDSKDDDKDRRTGITINKFEGWALGTRGFGDTSARVLDLELAKHLGFERPRKIRELIERLQKEGSLPGVYMRPTVGRKAIGRKTGKAGAVEYETAEYWLTQSQALFVSARSATKKGSEILWALIRVFEAAAEDWKRQQEAHDGALVVLLLAERACDWSIMWKKEFAAEICRLDRVKWDGGGSQPRFLASTYWRIYRAILSPAVYRELKKRNRDPKFRSNHHQFLTPEARDVMQRHVVTITALARTSNTKDEFWARFDHEYSKAMLQIGFFPPTRTPPRRPRPSLRP